MNKPLLSLVVTTYEWPEALDVVLRAFSEERAEDFEILVADDGSGPRTADVVNSWRGRVGRRIEHVWQPDAGWRKARIENLAVLWVESERLVFFDGDMIPRRGFVAAVRDAFRPGWFLATKRLNLGRELSDDVLRGVPVWRWSTLRWLFHATPCALLVSAAGARQSAWIPRPIPGSSVVPATRAT